MGAFGNRNLLGGNWAYETLGWGGFWAWDPVENAGLLPWLTLSALLHTLLLQARTGLLKKWNLALVVFSFGLTIFGTFLTRSGIISSVHAFVQNKTFTISFTAFLFVVLVYGLGLIFSRRGLLKGEKNLESLPLLSRPSALVFTCVILVAMTFTTFLGNDIPASFGSIHRAKAQFRGGFLQQDQRSSRLGIAVHARGRSFPATISRDTQTYPIFATWAHHRGPCRWWARMGDIWASTSQ